MSYIKELKELLNTDILPEVKTNIEELKNEVEKKKNNKEANESLKYMQDVEAYFEEALQNIENKSMTEEIAQDVLEGLEEMKVDDQREKK